jgi:hypothetical protein
MPFTNHDDVAKAFPSNRADHPLGIRVLPRRAGRNHHFPDLQRRGLSRKSLSIDLVSVPNQIPGRLVQHARLQQLSRRPFRGRMLRHVEMHQPAPPVPQHHEHKQHSKRRRRHGEEIQGDQILGVVLQRWPRLAHLPDRDCWRSARFSSANSRCVRTAHRSVPRRIPSHLTMTPNSGSAQQAARQSQLRVFRKDRIGGAHSPNQITELRTDRGPTGTPPTLPGPVASKALAVPGNHRLGPDHQQRMPPTRPQPRQQNPEDSIHPCQSRAWLARLPHRELLPQRQVLQR